MKWILFRESFSRCLVYSFEGFPLPYQGAVVGGIWDFRCNYTTLAVDFAGFSVDDSIVGTRFVDAWQKLMLV